MPDAARLIAVAKITNIDPGRRLAADTNRVEERFTPHTVNLRGEFSCQIVDALRDPLQAGRTVPDRVHRGHDRQQDLRGTNVAGGFVAADVLFARLQGQPQGGLALGIL